MANNTTNTSCDELIAGQEAWWIYIVTFAILYCIMAGLSSIAYAIHILYNRKRQKSIDPQELEVQWKFHELVRRIISGDSLLSRSYILVTFACNLTYLVLTIHRAFEKQVYYCYSPSVGTAGIMELVIVLELMSFSLIRLFAANKMVWYWFHLYTIVDILTLPHIFVSLALGVDWLGLRSARFIWLTQLITVFRFIPWIKSQNLIDFVALFVYFVVLIGFGAGIIHLLEISGDPWRDVVGTHDMLSYGYYIIVTITTVGYGDIVPVTTIGRIFMVVYLIFGLVFFAGLLPLMSDLLRYLHVSRTYSSFDRSRVSRHVIVCGHINAFTAKEFLADFLHPDRGDSTTHVLFLHPNRPTRKLRNVLRTHYTRVQYIVGSVLDTEDLKKCKILASSAIFILADKYTNTPQKEDNANLLRLVSVKNITLKVQVIIQLLLGLSKKQVSNIEGWNPGSDIVVCLNELKLGLLAQSCVCPGFSTLIANLFYTSDFPALKVFNKPDAWKEDYNRGASNEIYATHFSPSFEGKNFQETAQICYNKLGLILVAFELPNGEHRKLHINPSNPQIIVKAGIHGTRGYFVGQDVDHVAVVTSYCHECDKDLTVCCDNFDDKVCRVIRKVSQRKCKCFPNLREVVSECPLQYGARELSDIKSDDIHVPHVTFAKRPSHWAVSFVVNEDFEEVIEPCHLNMSEPRQLHEALLSSDSMPFKRDPYSLPKLEDHTIICVFADEKSSLLGLQHLISPLRGKNVSPKPVVIVSKSAFLKHEWPFIQGFSDVHLVDGCPLRIYNLVAAGIDSCSVCIVTSLHAADSDEPAVNDKEVVLCYLSIQKYLKQNTSRCIQVIADLRHEANIKFLDFGDEDEPNERIYKAQPFACGEAFSVSMMDSVTSSAFHSPGMLYLVEELIQSTSCQIVGIPLNSEEYTDKTFQDLFNLQLSKNNLVLGLYRKLPESFRYHRNIIAKFTRNKHYVITSPQPRTILDPSDIAFVLVNKESPFEESS